MQVVREKEYKQFSAFLLFLLKTSQLIPFWRNNSFFVFAIILKKYVGMNTQWVECWLSQC
jgi:hypothetical protein